MTEIVASYDEERVDRELAFALAAVDEKDADSLRWLATLVAAKLDYMRDN